MYMGVDYYPEQWDFEMMDSDIERIAAMGGNIIRIGEFAWHLMESEEGKYDFSFFDTVIEKAKKKGLKVVFGTPTATFPAWLAAKYPSILIKDENLMSMSFGGRRQYCYNSPEYKMYSEKIVEKLVTHYKDEEAIIVWQIDNEFGHEGSDMCYCDNCKRGFTEFLKRKYNDDINDLNERWGTMFWGQTYNKFEEIPMPTKTITTHNPSLKLDWARFRSFSLNRYANEQTALVTKLKGKHQRTTTNVAGGFFDKYFDHAENVKNMDFASWDNYPVWGGLREPIPPYAIAGQLDFIRGLRDQNFWIMEQLVGAQGHNIMGYLPRPNQSKMWSYQAFAHGCDSMLYFRWRAATKGAEQFCYGVIDHDNKDGRKYREVKSVIEGIKPYGEVLKSPVKSDIAVVYDFENIWAWRAQPTSSAFDINNEIIRMYVPFYYLNTNIDIIPSDRDLSKYKVVIMPVMMIADQKLADNVKAFVENGGNLILTFRSGMRNRDNTINLGEELPGVFRDMAGVTIGEVESLQTGQKAYALGTGALTGLRAEVEVFRDMITPVTAVPLFMYEDKLFADKACVTVNNFGKGKVYYVGAGFDPKMFYPVAKNIVMENGIEFMETEMGLEAYVRIHEGKKYIFLMNHTDEEKKFEDKVIGAYGTMIIER